MSGLVRTILAFTTTALLMAFTTMAMAQADRAVEARAVLVDAEGENVGEVTFGTENGVVVVTATVHNLPPGGFHGFHIHAVGACEPDFGAAGGHFNPTGEPHGDHAGDMPVLLVMGDGTGVLSFHTDRVTIEDLLAGDGTSIIIHAQPDNFANIAERYAPDGPDDDTLATGDAGPRIACGVIESQGQ